MSLGEKTHMTNTQEVGRYPLPNRLAVPDLLPISLLGIPIHLTMRQAVLLLCGWSLAFHLWTHPEIWSPVIPGAGALHVALPALLTCLTTLFALVRLHGRSLERWLLVLTRYALCPRRVISRREGDEPVAFISEEPNLSEDDDEED